MPEDDDDYESYREHRLSQAPVVLTDDEIIARNERIAILVRSKPALPDPALFGISTEAPASVMIPDAPLTVQDIMHERTEVKP